MLFFKSKEIKELDSIITRLEANMSNNYKDNAQDNLRQLIGAYEQLCAAGRISEKNKTIYGQKIEEYENRMSGFTHKDQKPYWT